MRIFSPLSLFCRVFASYFITVCTYVYMYTAVFESECIHMYRLNASFRDSFLAISRKTLILLSIFIILVGIIFPPLFFIFSPPACLWKWIPPDFNTSDPWMLCDVYTGDAGDKTTMIVSIANVLVITANIIYESIFCLKLNKLLKSKLDEESSWKLKALIIKNSLLTAIAASTTFIFWSLWVSIGAWLKVGIGFLYFDYWLNCFLVGLMFEYNEKYYLRLFPKCIICCFLQCDKSFDKNDAFQHHKQMEKTQQYISGLYACATSVNDAHSKSSKTDRNMTIKTSNDHDTTMNMATSNDEDMDIDIDIVNDTKTEIIYAENENVSEGMNEDKKEFTIVTTTNFTIDNDENKQKDIKFQFDSTVKISSDTKSSENEVITPTVSVVMNTEVTTPTVPTRTNAMIETTKSPPMRPSNTSTVTAFSMTCNAVIPSLEHRITPVSIVSCTNSNGQK